MSSETESLGGVTRSSNVTFGLELCAGEIDLCGGRGRDDVLISQVFWLHARQRPAFLACNGW